AGLRHALDAALAAHRREPPPADAEGPRRPRTVEQYPAAARLAPGACVHCHNVNEFRRDALQAAGKWKLDEGWAYPLPENLGLTLDVDRGDRVRAVAAGSAGGRARRGAGGRARRGAGRA